VSAPEAFCTRCRSLLDEGQRCECEDAAQLVSLDEDADARISEALLLTSIQENDRVVLSIAVGLMPISTLYLALYVGIGAAWPEAADALAWALGIPFLLLAGGWTGLVLWSAVVARRVHYAPSSHVREAPTIELETGTLERGRIIATEIHLRGDDRQLIVRDARIQEALVIRRPGGLIRVPVGRIDLFVASSRWRTGMTPLTSEWKHLPMAILNAGAVRSAKSKTGERIALAHGELEALGHGEASFRESAIQELVWHPHNNRTTLVLG